MKLGLWATAIVGVSMVASGEAPVTLSAAKLKPVNANYDRQTYVAIELPVVDLEPAFKRAEQHAGQPLKSRGEAHLTVVTPPEYQRLSLAQKKALILDLGKLDWSVEQIHPVCVGRAQLTLQGQMETAYFVVVQSKAIETIRKAAGLTDFEPHITLGFSKRDLHREDGIRKDASTCVITLDR